MSSPPLARLRLRDFRCFGELDWRPPAARTLLVGANGSGKTTLLEAIYLAATTRSFRAARLGACARRGAGGFHVALEVGERPRRELVLGWSGDQRARSLDGRETALAEHLAVLPVLAWTRAEGDLVAGAPSERRRFLDRGLVHVRPPLLDDLARYRRALAEKRALLARGGDARGLDAWNALLARHGARLAAARATLAQEVGRELGALAREHAPELPAVTVSYRTAGGAPLVEEEELLRALAAASAGERRRRQALVGPHRDDLELGWDGAAARGAVSAGEAKLLALLLVAAMARRLAEAGREPALLVDDADAELDPGRSVRLAAALAEFSQVLLTSSREEVWRGVGGFAVSRLEGPGRAPFEGSVGDS